MKPRQGMQIRVIAGGIVLALLFHPFASAQEPVPPQATSNQSQTGEPASPQADVADTAAPPSATQPSEDQLPDSPGTVQSRASQPQAMTPGSAQADNSESSDTEPTPSQQSAQSQQQQTPHEPVGTAAAELVKTTGVAASRPAGAAVAPAKQRRVRSILIKVGALVGVGAAVATTWALSQGSPSKPPGSH